MSELNTSVTTPIAISDSTIKLRDGRVLAMMSFGKKGGFPIFHCHGHPCSRFEGYLFAQTASALDMEMFVIDRPGIGRSDSKKGYRMLDWPDDLVEVADQLGIERFAVQGISGGGAYALACAYKIPQRLTACGLISTLLPAFLIRRDGPRNLRNVWWLGEHVPWLIRLYMAFLMNMRGTDPAKIDHQLLKMSSLLPAPDQKVMQDPEIRNILARTFAESAIRGKKGNLDEVATLVAPWGFDMEDIQHVKVFLWHGEEDKTSPVGMTRTLAQMLPNCTATFYPEAAHISTTLNYQEEILKTLKSPNKL